MSDPKKHHFLPQFYLKQFKVISQSGKYSQIWQVEKTASLNPKKVSIKDIGCKTDYHTLDLPDQEKDRKTIENALSRLEAKQANIVKEICATNQISEEIKPSLADFIATMRYRVPVFKEFIEKSLKADVQNTFKILMHQKELPPPPKELKELFQKEGYDCIEPKIFNWIILKYMLDMAFNSNEPTILRKMKWRLILAPSGCHFITGDSPVAIYHPTYKANQPHGVGLICKDVEISFPISKECLVSLSWNGKDEFLQGQKKQVAEYNRRTIVMAKKYIFASEINPNLEKQIVRYYCSQAGYKTENIWYGEGALSHTYFVPVTVG
ncbi:MAG: DUF4238 domain-containing protein [Phycisphaerae bacterium]|jgi:hypothetical protein